MPTFKGAKLDTNSASQVWTAALGQLEVEIPRPNFETWLRKTTARSVQDGVLTVITPNAFTAEMLEKRLSASIERAVEQVARRPLEIRFAVQNSDSIDTWESPHATGVKVITDENLANASSPGNGDETAGRTTDSSYKEDYEKPRGTRFRPEFTFEQYVSGPSNELAHAAALQVSEAPGVSFNPLYIYSPVGLGKTHLMHAIGHRLSRQGMSVLYVSAERFTNEYIRAIREGATEDFRNRYRNVDALMVDDIQFITGKTSTQEGFFHTFNELHMAGKQIVISSDQPAEKIKLEDRIQSRLSGGLMVDISSPDYETRYAIVEQKAIARGCTLPSRVIEVLASAPVESVRDLEGGLNRVIAYAQLTQSPVDVELAEKALVSIGSKRQVQFPSPESVLSAVAAHTGVPESSITGARRDRRTSAARRLAAFMLREESKLTATHAGEILGGKDHSSVLYAQKRFEEEHEASAEVRKLASDIRAVLQNTSASGNSGNASNVKDW